MFDSSTPLQLLLRNPLKNDDEDDTLVSHFLALGADAEQRDNLGKTALHWACWNDNLPGLRELLKWGASLDVEDFGGFPPLHYATAEKTKVLALQHLTKLQIAGVQLNEKNESIMGEILFTTDEEEVRMQHEYRIEKTMLEK